MQFSRRDVFYAFVILVLGLGTQAVWIWAVPFSWGWDSAANLAIGRMYSGLPYSMWSIKDYYPPAYPIFLTLMGVHHAGTIAYMKIGTVIVGGLMPLFLFLMVRPFSFLGAILASLVFVATLSHALFSTDMMNHHFHAFQLLFMSMLFAWYLYRPSISLAVVVGVAAALAYGGRQVSGYVFFTGIFVLMLAAWLDRQSLRQAAKGAVVLVLAFVVSVGALSLGRMAALGGPFQFGLTYDNGMRVMFQGAYFGGSIYQKQFHPGSDYVFVKPENGRASARLFETMKAYFEIASVKDVGLSDTNDKAEALKRLIDDPNVRNTYTIWFGLDNQMGSQAGDRLLRRVVIETIIAQPRVLRYYLWNLWRYVFREPTVAADTCVKCVCPPCFATALPQSFRGGFMGEDIFKNVAPLTVIAQMAQEHERAKATQALEKLFYADAKSIFVAKPVLVILLFASVLLSRGKTRYLMLYCVAAFLVIGGTTALAWPVQGRYQYPALPYIVAGASVAIVEIVRSILTYTRGRGSDLATAAAAEAPQAAARLANAEAPPASQPQPTTGETIQETVRHTVRNLDPRSFFRMNLNGQELWLPPATIQTMTHCVHMDALGHFFIHVERAHLDWVRARLKPGSHFLDVGAATGAFCLPIAKEFGPSVAIVAFEPATAARMLLTSTMERNGLSWIKVLPIAVSNEVGQATFYEYQPDETGEVPFLPEASTLGKPASNVRVQPVSIDVTTLDGQFAADLSIKHAAMKIDVEGFEAKVLEGGLLFFKRIRPAMAIDIHANPFGEGTTEDDVRRLLTPLGYRFEKIAHVLTCEVI